METNAIDVLVQIDIHPTGIRKVLFHSWQDGKVGKWLRISFVFAPFLHYVPGN